MPSLAIDRLNFVFPNSWQVSKYDEWAYYVQKFQSMCGGGVKGIDILAIDPHRIVWFVEVKDYRQHSRTKISEVAQEIADKVFDTLAGILPAQVYSDAASEIDFAKMVHRATKLRVVLHLEQPAKHSALFPRAINPLDVQQKLRSLVRHVDAHAIVCEMQNLGKVDWKVLSI